MKFETFLAHQKRGGMLHKVNGISQIPVPVPEHQNAVDQAHKRLACMSTGYHKGLKEAKEAHYQQEAHEQALIKCEKDLDLQVSAVWHGLFRKGNMQYHSQPEKVLNPYGIVHPHYQPGQFTLQEKLDLVNGMVEMDKAYGSSGNHKLKHPGIADLKELAADTQRAAQRVTRNWQDCARAFQNLIAIGKQVDTYTHDLRCYLMIAFRDNLDQMETLLESLGFPVEEVFAQSAQADG